MITLEESGLIFLKNKYDTFAAFTEWKVMIERQTEKKVKVLRTDNGGEFCTDAFDDYYRKKTLSGITPSHTLRNRMVWPNA